MSDLPGGRKRFGVTASVSMKKMSAPRARAPGNIHRSTSASFAKISRNNIRTSPGFTRDSSLSEGRFTKSCEKPSFRHRAALCLHMGHTLPISLMNLATSPRMLSNAEPVCSTSSVFSARASSPLPISAAALSHCSAIRLALSRCSALPRGFTTSTDRRTPWSTARGWGCSSTSMRLAAPSSAAQSVCSARFLAPKASAMPLAAENSPGIIRRNFLTNSTHFCGSTFNRLHFKHESRNNFMRSVRTKGL
mmetsp:Transcript_30635/g.88421  ORF Transcript_30635/g.88421 Transcript_30635/m.88421 type:complete len:249 (-) Transcript_30635:244-990(-)